MSSKQKQIDNDIEEYKKDRMAPCAHLLTTSSQMNNIMPNVTLDALGLNPVIEMPWSGGTKCHQRTAVIKFAIVKELQQFLIFSILCWMFNLRVTTVKCLCTML